MKDAKPSLTLAIVVMLCVAGWMYGPITQPPGYHRFADSASWLGIPHFFDVSSNAFFLLTALWGWRALSSERSHPALAHGWDGYRLFLIGLALTAVGSAYYHLSPDNARLVWDRIPIALTCAGLLAGVWGDTHGRSARAATGLVAALGVASVVWWQVTEQAGRGDLRPYLGMQALTMLLIPLWQAAYDARKSDRWFFGAALIAYAVAKLAELADHEIAAVIGVTGHTLKHLLAACSAALIVAGLMRRVRDVPSPHSLTGAVR